MQLNATQIEVTSEGAKLKLIISTSFLAVALNVAVVAFYVLWSIADTSAINAMEDSVGYDESYMLPNAYLMGAFAHSSMALLLGLDACLIALFLRVRGRSSVKS